MCCAVLSHSVVPDSLRLYGLKPARLLCPWGFSRQEYCSGLPCPPPRELPNPGIKPRSSALQADSLPAEPPRKAQEYWSWYLSLLQQIFQTQESNLGLLHCRQILYQLSYQGSPINIINRFKIGKKNTSLYIVTLLILLTCRVYHVKYQNGWIARWNQDCREKYQQPQICIYL